MKTSSIISLNFVLLCLFITCFHCSISAQNFDTTILKEKNRIRVDSVEINLKNISTQLVTLRDSLGVEIMSLDKKMVNMQPKEKTVSEKTKNRFTIYRTELDKLIEEVAVADISYITEVKKRAYHTVLDVRADFVKSLSDY